MQKADHAGFVKVVVAKLKEMRWRRFHATGCGTGSCDRETAHGAVRLEGIVISAGLHMPLSLID